MSSSDLVPVPRLTNDSSYLAAMAMYSDVPISTRDKRGWSPSIDVWAIRFSVEEVLLPPPPPPPPPLSPPLCGLPSGSSSANVRPLAVAMQRDTGEDEVGTPTAPAAPAALAAPALPPRMAKEDTNGNVDGVTYDSCRKTRSGCKEKVWNDPLCVATTTRFSGCPPRLACTT